MNEWPIHWAHPERAFVLGVWLLVFVGLVWLERRGDDALDRLVGPALRARLVVQPSRWRRRARLALVGL
ncbi:MAG TPA: hypothetical protein PLW10_22965, partial [Myxococcota bacterium]|nr:hypothetical protein [Myxococcota bacterium]